MKWSSLALLLTPVPWLILVFGVILSVLIWIAPVDADNLLILLFVYLCGALPLLFIAITWLMLSHRRIFTSGWGWITPVICMLVSSLPVNQPLISLLFSISLPLSLWAIGVATLILLWQRDLGLKLLGWVSAIYVWTLMLTWRYQGNLIELWLQSVNNLSLSPPWWNNLWCVMAWVVPISLLSVIRHTVRLIWRELH